MSLLRSRDVLELGANLVAQFDRKDDLLASWMAHYIAELIDNVDNATPDTKAAAQEACAKAILELWRRRSSWPPKVRPFMKLEPILRTLESLDIEQPTERYFTRERHEALAAGDEETRNWLAFARDIDRAARFLIRTALRTATTSTAESISPWIALAKNAEIDGSVETRLLEVIINADEDGDAAEMREASLRLSLSQIESFLRIGATFADELRSCIVGANDGRTPEQHESDDGGVDRADPEGHGEHHSREEEIATTTDAVTGGSSRS